MERLKPVLVVGILGLCAGVLSATVSVPANASFEGVTNNNPYTLPCLWWQSPWDSVITTGDGNKKGLSSDGYTEHEDIGFIIHSVGDLSKPVVYSFYVINDVHIGDVDSFPDYNETGWQPNLNLDRNPDNMGGLNSSWPDA